MQKDDGFLELVHVHGTEKDKNFKYVNGNDTLPWGLYAPYFWRFVANAGNSGHLGLTVPDVKTALTSLEKHGVQVFKPLGVAKNAHIPVPQGMTTIVPGYVELYKQIVMIRVSFSL